MFAQTLRYTCLVLLLGAVSSGQVLSIPTSSNNRFSSAFALDGLQTARLDFDFFTINSHGATTTPLQTPSGSVSMLDLKAPGKAQREYQKGYQLFMRKDLEGAAQHLARAIAIYPKFVAAHNTLGTVYLDLKQNEKARAEFSTAISLDEHMPNSYLNLSCAQLGLEQYGAAEETLKKASTLAPLDNQVELALVYAEFSNKDYPAVITTAHEIHSRKHEGVALAHFFAAAAFESQKDLQAARDEMQLLLREDSKSPSAAEFRKILEGLNQSAGHGNIAPITVKYSIGIPTATNPEVVNRMAQLAAQNLSQREQIDDAEKADEPACPDCRADVAGYTPQVGSDRSEGTIIRADVNEVSILFAATDHGKSVTDLASSNVQVRDNSQPPNAVLHFRNETQLPLRLGLVIDTSNSVIDRFKFEQGAAIKFLNKVITSSEDQAFVVGVNNSVLLVQDFTSDLGHVAHAIDELAPAGGTALWDAVNFAAEKVASRPESQPVARVIVVISDGEDNSSSVTLKEAISTALHREVAVYTVSTRDALNEEESAVLGERALRTISELTGGAAYSPGSISRLNGSLSELNEVIRGRYLISYRPATFQRDGKYRAVDITAEKNGRKLRVYARRGTTHQPRQDSRLM